MPKKPANSEPPQEKYLNSLFKNFFIKFANIFPTKQNYINQTKQNIITSNFESFAEKTAEDVMIPRADIVAVKFDISLEELSKVIIKRAHTRILIYKEKLDNIIGFVHIKDLFEVFAKSQKYNLKKLTRKQLISPHSTKLVDLLKQMQVHRTHIAVIVDEHGGTDGIVTIEDIIEAIVGPIDDEHDIDLNIQNYKILKPGVIIANARMEIEELEEILSIKLKDEDDEFDTIGGLVMSKAGNVPVKGKIFNIADGVSVEIIDSTPRAIKQLKVMLDEETDK